MQILIHQAPIFGSAIRRKPLLNPAYHSRSPPPTPNYSHLPLWFQTQIAHQQVREVLNKFRVITKMSRGVSIPEVAVFLKQADVFLHSSNTAKSLGGRVMSGSRSKLWRDYATKQSEWCGCGWNNMFFVVGHNFRRWTSQPWKELSQF